MGKRNDMILKRLKLGLSDIDMAIKCKTSRRIIHLLEDYDESVTHPAIARRVGKAYGLSKKETELLMPENYRRSSPNYDPTRYSRESEFDVMARRLPTFTHQRGY